MDTHPQTEEVIERIVGRIDDFEHRMMARLDQLGPQIEQQMPELVTTKLAAELLSVRQYTIRRWINDNRLKAVKVNGYFRIPRRSILELMEDVHA
jgi:excisionase family DNA binding protein